MEMMSFSEEIELMKVERKQLLATLNEVIELLHKLAINHITITDLICHEGWQNYELDGAEVTMHILLDYYKGVIEYFERVEYLTTDLDKLLDILRHIIVLLDKLSDIDCKECTTNSFHHRKINEAISKQFRYLDWISGDAHERLAKALKTARTEIFCDYVDWEGMYAALDAL